MTIKSTADSQNHIQSYILNVLNICEENFLNLFSSEIYKLFSEKDTNYLWTTLRETLFYAML